MLYQANFKKGFSLVESLIVISIIMIFSSVSFLAYNSIRTGNNLESAGLEIIGALRYSQTNAKAVKENSSWGVKILENNIIVFKGDSYLDRDIVFDETYRLSAKIESAGLDEVVFKKLSGFVDSPGFIFLSSGEKEKNIQINEKGVIFY